MVMDLMDNVELDIIGIAMEVEIMMAYVTKGEYVEDKQKMTKHQTLGDTLGWKSLREEWCG